MYETEEKLIEGLKNGEEAAFSSLIEKYQRFVFNVAIQSCRNYDDASDITQEVFIKVYRSIHGFKSKSALSTWLYTICKNMCVDFQRKNKLYNSTIPIESEDDEGDKVELQLPDDTYSPELKFERRETADILRRAIDSLPKDSREIILMRDVNDMTYNEIADSLGIELGTVRSRLARARMKLRNIIVKII